MSEDIAVIAVIARNPTPAGQERPDLGTPVIAVIGKAGHKRRMRADQENYRECQNRQGLAERAEACSIPLWG
jgi:hypothetical protein